MAYRVAVRARADAARRLARVDRLAPPQGWLELVPDEMPRPPDFLTWNAKRQQASTRSSGIARSREKPYCASAHSHSFVIGSDGRFRDRGRRPGLLHDQYQCPRSAPGLSHALERNRFGGTIEHNVEVGAIPGGHSDEPLDLGAMPLKIAGTPEPD